MRINISLNPKSIRNAIKVLQTQEKVLRENMLPQLLLRCCEFVKERANQYVETADLGRNVIQGIQSGWEIETLAKDRARLVNNYDRAVFVEFGVGVVGEQSPHEYADREGYEYNVPSEYKLEDGSWVFYTNVEDLDLPEEALDLRIYFHEPKRKSERMNVKTHGAKGLMYAYNAVVDLKTEKVKEIWNAIKKAYWG